MTPANVSVGGSYPEPFPKFPGPGSHPFAESTNPLETLQKEGTKSSDTLCHLKENYYQEIIYLNK